MPRSSPTSSFINVAAMPGFDPAGLAAVMAEAVPDPSAPIPWIDMPPLPRGLGLSDIGDFDRWATEELGMCRYMRRLDPLERRPEMRGCTAVVVTRVAPGNRVKQYVAGICVRGDG